GIAAIARAGDANAFRIDPALLDRPLQRVRHVVLHCASPLPPPGLVVLKAKPESSAKFRFDHDVASRGEELRIWVPLPALAAHPRSPVHEHDGRPRVALPTNWKGHPDR